MPLKILRDLFQIKLKCFEVEQIFNFNTEITYFIFFFNCTHKTFLLDPLLSRRDERVLFATAHIKKWPTPSPKLINAIKISSYFVKFFLSKFFTKNSKFCSSFFVFITKDVSISKWKKKINELYQHHFQSHLHLSQKRKVVEMLVELFQSLKNAT